MSLELEKGVSKEAEHIAASLFTMERADTFLQRVCSQAFTLQPGDTYTFPSIDELVKTSFFPLSLEDPTLGIENLKTATATHGMSMPYAQADRRSIDIKTENVLDVAGEDLTARYTRGELLFTGKITKGGRVVDVSFDASRLDLRLSNSDGLSVEIRLHTSSEFVGTGTNYTVIVENSNRPADDREVRFTGNRQGKELYLHK